MQLTVFSSPKSKCENENIDISFHLAEDEQQMNYESGPRDFSVICFADATSIHESFFNGNSTMNFIARPGDQVSQLFLSKIDYGSLFDHLLCDAILL